MQLARTLTVCLVLSLFSMTAIADDLVAIRGATIETVGPQGRLENATLLIRGNKIEAIGKDITIPVAARIVEGHGLTVIPGVVDPYFAVQIGRTAQPTETRTVTVGGRTFNIGGGSPAVSTSFAKVAAGINLDSIDWDPARRTGSTHLQLVAPGFCQSALASVTDELVKIEKEDGDLLLSVTNDTRSLDVLRNGLREPRSGGPTDGAPGRSRGGPSSTQGGVPTPGTGQTPAPGTGGTPAASEGTPAPSPSGRADIWKPIRDGEAKLFVNVNNAAAILHALAASKDAPKAKLVFVASGADVFRVIDELDPQKHTVILAPRLETIPNSMNLVNVPKLLAEKKIPFAFSTSLGQTEFREQQDAPFFSTSLLVRGGLAPDIALQNLTISPAKLLGIDKEVGSLEVGKKSNFVILNDAPFGATTAIQSVYVEGKQIYENQ